MIITKYLLVVWLGLIVWLPVMAAGEHGGSVEEMMQDIMMGQVVSEFDQIDCEEVSEIEWEKLGDAAMGDMVGDNEQHESMDNMMGGEGSESLRAMHINMGRQYLNCGESMGVMSGKMNMMSGFGGMMGSNMFGLNGVMLGMGGMVVFWMLVIGLFVAWFNRKQNGTSSNKTALDIVKERYARGEINKKEFEIKKRDL